jgi:hypothetical protein
MPIGDTLVNMWTAIYHYFCSDGFSWSGLGNDVWAWNGMGSTWTSMFSHTLEVKSEAAQHRPSVAGAAGSTHSANTATLHERLRPHTSAINMC